MNNTNRPLIIFYMLVIYVILQSVWWAYHILDLNNEMYQLKAHIEKTEEFNDKLQKRKLMVIGEGSVFLCLLLAGAYFTRQAFNREVKLSHRQKNFLMSVTHELRSPLSSIKLYLQTLAGRELDEKKSKQIIQNALSDTDRLAALVDNMLLATTIDTGNYPMQMENINFSGLVKEIVSKLCENGLNVNRFRISESPEIFVCGDKEALTSICCNLFENAMKYSPEESVVEVELSRKESVVQMQVKDQGRGVPDNEKENIFKKFYRIGDEATRNTKGTGLGLYIVKYLVEKLNGRVSLSDNSPKGSIFTIMFVVS